MACEEKVANAAINMAYESNKGPFLFFPQLYMGQK